MKRIEMAMIAVMTMFSLVADSTAGQSSSLYHQEAIRPQLQAPIAVPQTRRAAPSPSAPLTAQPSGAPTAAASTQRGVAPRRPSTLAPAIAQHSLTAVSLPQPHVFQLHDLVTIVVAETTTSSSDATLGTTKEITLEGEIAEFPRLQLTDLLNFQVNPSNLSDREPKLDVEIENEFKGKGKAQRRDSFTTQLTAEIIDIKPNGNLVLSAQRHVEHDKETLELTLTGTCRAEDISAANSVISSRLHNLTLVKKHTGEVRKASKKGWLTKLFEGIFNI